MPAPADAHAPFLVRHRRAATIGAGTVLVLLFGLHLHRWHFPYRVAGAADEWPLFAATVAVTLAAWWSVPLVLRRLAKSARLPAAAIVGVIAFLVLQAADPFVAIRDWRYAPAGCDFAVSFPERPRIVEGEIALPGAPVARISRAVLIDVGRARALSAECVPVSRAAAEHERSALLDAVENLLQRSTVVLRLRNPKVTRTGEATLMLTGVADEGRTADNEVLLRKAEARAQIGPASLLVLWAWRITRDENAGVDAAPFLESVRPATPR